MSSPRPASAALSYDALLETAKQVQKGADRNLIIGCVLMGTQVLGPIGLPFFIHGLWKIYKAEQAGLPVRPVMVTFIGYLALLDGSSNVFAAMIDVLANHSLIGRVFLMGVGSMMDAGYFWQYNTLLVGGASVPGEKAFTVATGVVMCPARMVGAWGLLKMKRWGLQWMVITSWMGVYAWVAYMWNFTTYAEMRLTDVLGPVWFWWAYNIWYMTPFIIIPYLYTVNREMFADD